MKRIIALFVLGLSVSGLAIPAGDADFWDTSAYVEPQMASAVSMESVSYDGFVKVLAVKVCDFFCTLPTGMMLIFR